MLTTVGSLDSRDGYWHARFSVLLVSKIRFARLQLVDECALSLCLTQADWTDCREGVTDRRHWYRTDLLARADWTAPAWHAFKSLTGMLLFARWTATELACFTGRPLSYYKTSCKKEGKVIVKECQPMSNCTPSVNHLILGNSEVTRSE